jgi:uncharacterized RDD family membrane protein YckC
MTAIHDRTSQYLEGTRRTRRELVTPEGVPLPVEIAQYGERAAALMIDLLIWFGATLLMVLSVVLLFNHGWRSPLISAIFLLVLFMLRTLYFTFFELAWQGATPGKRAMALRVADRHGGPLQPAAVVARNLTREIETFIPFFLLLSALLGGPTWEQLLAAAWLLCFAALPLFNRDRMRAGDLIAGTIVIALPRRRLSIDLVEAAAEHAFTDDQLRAYGAFELQVLEELLRRPDAQGAAELLSDICTRICRKIGWPDPVPPARTGAFLRDFYTAQRAFLEREQLFGRSRADKHEAGSNRTRP